MARKWDGNFSAVETGVPLGSVSCRVRDRNLKVRAGSISVVQPESCSIPAPVAEFRRSRRPGPPLTELPPAAAQVPAATADPPEHRALLPATSRKLWPFEHSRQPDEFWCSILPVTSRWPVVRFF